MLSSIVYVINRNGHRLMPCKAAKARKLLRAGRAKVVGRSPFTIKLLWDCEEHVQEVVGMDKGRNTTGICCVGKGEILLSGEIEHRKDVKEKLDSRRAHRRSRRQRQWYRFPHWKNRASSKRSGRLPPSIYSKGRLAFKRVKGEPCSALPKDCQLLKRGQTILWEHVA